MEISGIGLKEAKELVESAPCTVVRFSSSDKALTAANKLIEIGANVEIK